MTQTRNQASRERSANQQWLQLKPWHLLVVTVGIAFMVNSADQKNKRVRREEEQVGEILIKDAFA